jgi:hypothetical protein
MDGCNHLFQYFRDRMDGFVSHSFEASPDAPLRGADRWLLASLLQKAVRRGDVTIARRAAHHLLMVDPSRLWRRLMTIGLEDIGIGDVEAAAELIGIAALPQVRTLFASPAQAVDMAVRRACEAVKDRTGDHFGSLARDVSGSAEVNGLDEASVNALGAVLASPHLSWRRRLHAATLLGDWAEARAASRIEKFAFAAEIFEALDVPENLIAACAVYVARARDALPIFVPFGWCLWRGLGAAMAITSHALPQTEWVGELPSYAFDPLHTRLGRRAIDLWLRSYLQKPPFDGRQVSIALWNMEAALCARTLRWPLGEGFQEEAESADLTTRHLPLQRHGELRAWIAEERSVLLCARHAAWEGALREKTLEQQAALPAMRS